MRLNNSLLLGLVAKDIRAFSANLRQPFSVCRIATALELGA
jgi:hypothetical protein